MQKNVLIILHTLSKNVVSAKSSYNIIVLLYHIIGIIRYYTYYILLYKIILLYRAENINLLFIRRFVTAKVIYFVAFDFTNGIDCFCFETNKTMLYKH